MLFSIVIISFDFDNDANLCNKLNVHGFWNLNCDDFKNVFLSTLSEHAPMKKRYGHVQNDTG